MAHIDWLASMRPMVDIDPVNMCFFNMGFINMGPIDVGLINKLTVNLNQVDH